MGDEREFKNLPEGWKWVRLGEVIYFKNGESPTFSENGSYPIYGSNGLIGFSNMYQFKGNHLIVGRVGASGEVHFVSGKFFASDNCLIGCLLREKDLNLKYTFYYLKYFNLKRFITQTAQPLITQSLISNLKIPLPPLPEQQKIAEILETVDNAIEKTDKIIEKYKRIKQGLMQDLLTKGIDENGNIRDEKTHKFKDSPLGRIPEEWEVVRLGEVGEIISGSTPNTNNADYWNGEIVWITPEDLSKTKTIYIENSSRKITQQALKSCSIKIIPENSVVISSRAPIGYVKVSKVKFTTNQGCKSIAYNGSFSPEFLAFLLSNKIQDMINMGSGTTFQEITKSNLAKILIPLPPLSEQQRIAEILSQIDKTIEKEEQYKEKLKRIKQGLMEDLLTGKVRVKNIIEED
jgi:type I restriction enzyme S subunit